MGPVFDTLAIALGPGASASAFAAVLIAWIKSRSASVKVHLERDGQTITIDARGPKDVVVEAITRFDA